MQIDNIKFSYINQNNKYLAKKLKQVDNNLQTDNLKYDDIDYSKIAFCAIYNVKPKNVSIDAGKNKLLRQFREILSTESFDTDPEDAFMALLDRALNHFKACLEKKKEIAEEMENLYANRTMNAQAKYDAAVILDKKYKQLQKFKITVPVETKKEDEKIDYRLIRAFKSAIEDGNFNLRTVMGEFFEGLKNISTVEELNKLYPKIKTPKRPEEVISNKIAMSLNRDFYIEFADYIETNQQEKVVEMINNALVKVGLEVSERYSVEPLGFLHRIVESTTTEIVNRYNKLKETGIINSIPNGKKTTAFQITEQDIKMLCVDFDDFVLSTIRKHYLEGEKLNNITYTNELVSLKLSSLSGTDYKFEKMSEKIKKILKESDDLFKAQRDYPHYTVEDFKLRLGHYAEHEMSADDNIFAHIIDFDSCGFTQEDVNFLIKFLRELDDISDGKISLKEGSERIIQNGYSPKGTEKLNELERQKAEELIKLERQNALKLKSYKSAFNEAVNLLYMHNLNNIALTCAKYEPKSLNSDEIEKAEYIINLITSQIPKDISSPFNKAKFESSIRKWDTYITYLNSSPDSIVFKEAQKFAKMPDGKIDMQKAGQYLINSDIVRAYPESLKFVNNPEILSKVMENGSEKAIKYLCKYDDYKFMPEEEKLMVNLVNMFDIKNSTEKAILKNIIENDYLQRSTARLVMSDNNTHSITAVIAPKAKQQIYAKYKFPLCVEYFTAFEDALKGFASEWGSAGIKITGRNNKSNPYKMELKIIGENDRLFSSRNDYVFDIYSEEGMH